MYVDSPLHRSGLKNYEDYILGTEEKTFEDLPSFQEYLATNENKEVELMVFNKTAEKVQKVKMTPTSKWSKGSESLGLLGGVLGYGMDYSFPMKIESSKKEVMLDKSEEKKNSDITFSNDMGKVSGIGLNEEEISIQPKRPDVIL